ncbi:hypothetical protein DFH05DRAFT_1506041 [Lentinula detonsa]|uniref:Uncharacterized protein n=1 Tax=Lentinula detonsa TaxID=2804962 RepID=A0A9W8NV19_9AGAR|nr:hypothetical protein DFH05DRAFT_1506041 [Lentinula detonsa]
MSAPNHCRDSGDSFSTIDHSLVQYLFKSGVSLVCSLTMSSSVEYGYELESRLHSPTSIVKSESYRPVSYTLPSILKSDVTSNYRDPSTFEPSQPVEGRSRIDRDQQNRYITLYRSLSWIFGFKEKFSLLLCAYTPLDIGIGEVHDAHITSSLYLWGSIARFLFG